MLLLLVVSLLACGLAQDSADTIKELVRDKALDALQTARSDNEKQRICTCQEVNQCIDKSREQARQCFDPCFKEFAKLEMLSKPDVLKQCVKDKERLLDRILPCIKENLHSCTTDSKSQTKVPTIDFIAFVDQLEGEVDRRAQLFLRAVKSKDMEKIATAVKSSHSCFKNCFVNEKNPHGDCFAQLGCTPHITDEAAKKTIDTCGKKIDWNKEMDSICNCAQNAGMGVLKDFCELLSSLVQE